MGVIQNFNRSINITIKNSAGIIIEQIRTPQYGKKPNIEINGALYINDIAGVFDIKLKNYYLKNTTQQYQKIEISAGYFGAQQATLEGSIVYVFNEAPGPEGTTVIHCIGTDNEKWLNKTINKEFAAGFRFTEALKAISTALGFDDPKISAELGTLTGPEKWIAEGSCKDAVHSLSGYFANAGRTLIIRPENNRLIAYDIKNSIPTPVDIKYLTTPPQLTGGQEGAVYATFSAPWVPELRPGNVVKISTKHYSTKLARTAARGDYAIIRIETLTFQFGTVNSLNTMTIGGDIIQ